MRRMRKIKASATTGIIIPDKPKPQVHVGARIYKRPSLVLTRLDRLRQGAIPRIAVTRSQGGIGDVMMTLPTVRAMSKKYGCKIDYGTDFTYLDGALAAVLEGIPYINKIVPWREIEEEVYDAVLDLTCPCVAHEQPHAEPINRIDLFARHAAIPLEDHSIDYVMKEKEIGRALEELNNYPNLLNKLNKLILVQPSSSTNRRDVPVDVFPHLIRQLVTRDPSFKMLVFTHDDSDNAFAKGIDWKSIKNCIHMKNYKIREIAAFMHFCDTVICPDSSLLHLAGALNKKTVTFFGPTDPRARVNYYPRAVAIAPGKQLHCWPSWYTKCELGFMCWKRIDMNMSINTVLAVANNVPLPNHPDLVAFGDYNSSNRMYEIL